MGRREPFTQEDDDFMRAVYPRLGPSAIAKRLGRSRSGVSRRIGALGLRGRRSEKEPDPPVVSPDGAQDTGARLRELREILRRSLMDAEPRNIPSISAEYRATLDAIERLENDDGPGVGASGHDGGGLLVSIPLRPA